MIRRIAISNPVTQFQIIAKNPDNAADFYGQLFGWSIDDNNAMGYRVVRTGSDEGIQGGIWPSPPEGHPMVPLFVKFGDVASAADQASQLGATVTIEPQKLPDGDEMAVILDPEGVPFELFKDRA